MSDLWTFSSSSPPPIIHQSAPPLSSPSSLRNHGNAPHLLPPPPPPYVTSPQHLPPQLLPPQHLPPQHLLSGPHHDPGLINLNWRESELCSFDSVFYQTTALLDLQNQSGPDVTQQQDTHRFSYDAHPLVPGGVCGHGDTPGPGQDPWGPLETTLPQTQCPPVGSMSGGVGLGGWSSAAAGNQPNTHFFPDGYHEGYQDSYRDAYHDGYVPHVFCSPTTPGPSPHYPQTHSLSSPAPHIHPINENLGFHRETSTQLIPDQTFHRCPLTSEAPQHLLHQTSQHLLLNQADLIQDQTDVFDPSFSPQAGGQSVSGAAQGPSLAAGLMWSDKPGGGGAGEGGGRGRGGRGGRGGGGGGGGRGRRGRGGGGGGRGRGRGRGGGGGGGGGGGRGGGGGGGGEAQPQSVVFSSCNMKSSQPENNTKVLDNSRLLCTVCKRDFRSLPALNGHMRSHSCSKKGEVPPVRRSVSVVMPVSVPVQSRAASKACRAGQRRSSRSSPATGGAVLYRSLMHLEEQEVVTRGSAAAREVEGHYTPPPMLCPVRAGPGLYCSVTTRRQRRAPTVQLHSSNNGLSDLVAMETPATEINKPRINVGRGFQAEVPPLGNHKYAHSDSQNALWLWTPCDELEKPVNQQRVTTLLTMARSSVVPGGGASPEYALTVLSESAGDFLLTLEKLLSTPESSDQSRADVTWSAAETTALVKSLRLHRKDFSRVQRAVQTKSVSQCVEFYYLWKKHLSLRARPPAGLTVTLPETKVRSSSDHGDERDPERPSAPDRRR